MQYTEELKKQFGDKYGFLQVYSVVFSKSENATTITFLFDEKVQEITDEQREELQQFFAEKLNLFSTLRLKFKKSFLDEDLISKQTLKILQSAFKSSIGEICEKDISVVKNDFIQVVVSTTKLVATSLEDRGADRFLENALSKEFIAKFDVKIVANENKIIDTSILDKRERIASQMSMHKGIVTKRYEVGDVFMFFGQDITPKPEYIKNVNEEKMSVILSGVISNFQKKHYIKKREKAKGENAKQSAYYTFTLTDTSGRINCTYFSSMTNEKKMDKLCDDTRIIIVGDVQKFNNSHTCYIRSLGLCNEKLSAQKNVCDEEEASKELSALDFEYLQECEEQQHNFVRPYVEKHQVNIFDKKPTYSSYIMDNEFVIYDFETTGLDTNTCEIIEIGAVKIRCGEIVEVFQTLIKPQETIPDIITQVTNISNDMVAFSPSINIVMPAFYEFCKGCVLGGYNSANFDDKILAVQSRKLGVEFDNPTTDVILLARSKMASSNYKLSTVVKNLGIVLIGAHRALNDALATAKVLLKLNEQK